MFFFFSIQNIQSNCYIIFLIFFPIIFSWWIVLSFLAIFLVILCGYFVIFSWFNATITASWKHLSFLLIRFIVAFLFFIQLGESVYDALWFNLFHDNYNTITEYNHRKTHYLSWIVNYFDIYFKWIKEFFYNFICYITNHDFYAITSSSSLSSSKEIKLLLLIEFSICGIVWHHMMTFKNIVWFYQDILQLIVFCFYPLLLYSI